jgi:hypothetical protein
MRTCLIRGVVCVLIAGPAVVPYASAQTGTQNSPVGTASEPLVATGKVVGPGSQPQAGVPVMVEGPQGKTHLFTDAKGNWSLYNLPPGNYQVRPVSGAATTTQPIEFTVKEKGLLDKLFGGEQNSIRASEIKLDKDFKQ